MNKNLNLVEILKDCPNGIKLYSTIYGEVIFTGINHSSIYPITFTIDESCSVTIDGRHNNDYSGECTLFPSKDQRDWSEFKINNIKYKVYQFSYDNKGFIIIAAANVSDAYVLADKITNGDKSTSVGSLDCTYDGSISEKAICLLDRWF